MNANELENGLRLGYKNGGGQSATPRPPPTSVDFVTATRTEETTAAAATSSMGAEEEVYLSPTDSSSPSLEADSDEESSSSEDSPGPTLRMMGESQVRQSRAKQDQAHLALRVPATSRTRIVSNPLSRVPDLGDSLCASPEDVHRQASLPVPVPTAPANIPWSPAMAFLSGLNSPFSVPGSLESSAAPLDSSPPSIAPPPPPPPPSLPVKNQAPAEERIGPYVLGQVVGHGGFSVVRKATSASGVVAIKVIPTPTDPDTKSSLENEISIWSNLHHEHILPLFTQYRTEENIYLVSLYCPAGSLFDILRLHGAPGLPQDDVGTMFRQIVRGLRYLHEQVHLVHGDIKLENVLVDELGACRIADFGLSRYVTAPISRKPSDSDLRKNAAPPHLRGRSSHYRNSMPVAGFNHPSLHQFPAGSLPYAAPELLLPPMPSRLHASGENTGVPYPANPAQDIWALGCLLHALLFGRLPFADNYEPRLQMKILRGAWERGSSRTPPRSRTRGSDSRSASRTRSSSREKRTGVRFQHVVKPRKTSASRSKDVKIGKAAKKVLRGCLSVDIGRRWTIAQIDEVRLHTRSLPSRYSEELTAAQSRPPGISDGMPGTNSPIWMHCLNYREKRGFNNAFPRRVMVVIFNYIHSYCTLQYKRSRSPGCPERTSELPIR